MNTCAKFTGTAQANVFYWAGRTLGLCMLTSERRNKQVFSEDIFPPLDRVASETQRHWLWQILVGTSRAWRCVCLLPAFLKLSQSPPGCSGPSQTAHTSCTSIAVSAAPELWRTGKASQGNMGCGLLTKISTYRKLHEIGFLAPTGQEELSIWQISQQMVMGTKGILSITSLWRILPCL